MPVDQALIDKVYGEMKCEVCQNEPVCGVASIPFIPMSVAYGAKCLAANAHPWWALVANQAAIGDPLETTHPVWQAMVRDTCRHLGKTVEQFKADVAVAERDMEGTWDGVVKYDYATRQFVRYLDRNGEHKKPVTQ